VASESIESKYETQHRWAFKLTAILYIFVIMIRQGSIQQANFVPSPIWYVIFILISPLFGPAYWTMRKYLDKYFNGQLKIFENKFLTLISISGFLIYLVLVSFPAYFLLEYVLAPAVTSQFYTTVEKDISGTKGYRVSGTAKYLNRYYIATPDIYEGNYENLYITYDEFASINNKVRMHVTFKQSFFGMAVQSYIFLPSN